MTTISFPVDPRADVEETCSTFLALRPRLHGIARRILGSSVDAEDVVQDAWLRWQTCDRTQVRNPTAFLVTVTTRLALNVAQSARSRRELPMADWHPEPADRAAHPSTVPEAREALERGVARLFERLSAAERAAFVLRHGFDYPYPVIARVLGRSEVNTRQLVSRAGKRLAAGPSRSADASEQRRLATAVRAAADHGHVAALERVLAA